MRLHRPYELKEYDPNWVNEYNKRADVIKTIFGNELVEIHHIAALPFLA